MVSSKAISSSRLEFHLFGQFVIYIDGKTLRETAVKGRKARTLLKLIAHQRNYQMEREQVMNVLWPELDVEAASSQLYKALHHIRKAFADHSKEASDWIEMTDNLIRIVLPGGLVTDVQRFEETAREGLRDEKRSKLEMAVSIYAGDFLPMERYAEWASLPREHYRQLYLDVLTTLAIQYEQEGELSEAAEILRLALEKEPTLETAHRGLMRIFARKGQSTRAFHQYDLCREVLKEELGMSPTPETRSTLDDIREGRLAGQQEKNTLRGAEHAPMASPIIGRDDECSVIDRLLDKLSGGAGGVLVIKGEVGTGKSRLVQELVRLTRNKGLSFFLGRSGTSTGAVAYGPFVGLIDDALNKQPELESDLPVEIGRLVPGYSGKGDPVPHADKLAAKGYLFARIQRFFSRLSKDDPVIVILEDLHAADQGTLDLFSYLIRHSDELPILFVTTFRSEADEFISEKITDLQDRSIETIKLAPLTFDDLANLLYKQSPTAGISPDTVERIYRLSEGNPLFATELLRLHTEEDDNDPLMNREISGSGAIYPALEKIPSSLRYMVEQKLEKLSPPAHHLLYIAAVIGRQVPYELLASIWSDGRNNTEMEELFNALEEIIRVRLLEEQGLDYSFRHALVRETIYAAISEARRRTLHGIVASRLVEISAESGRQPVEKIAYHYLRAGKTLKGADYLIQAAQQAEGAYAHDDALELYREVYEILDGVEEKPAKNLRFKVLERTGDVYRACGRLEKSYDAYEEALLLAEEIPLSNQDLTELYRKMAVVAIFRTEIDRSEKYLDKANELVGNDIRAQARLFITKALHLWHLNRLEDAYDIAQKALKLAKEADSKAEASQACEILAMTCLPLGRWEEGLEYEMERQIYGWSPEIVVATDAHLCLWEYHVSGDQPLQQARLFMEQVAKQAAELGDLRCVAVCHYALGTMHLWRGHRRRAVEDLSSSLELHERVGSPAGMAYALARKSVLHTLMGAKELGWQAVQDGLAHAKQAAVRDHCLQRLYGVGIWNRLEADDLPQARGMVGKSEELLNKSGACAACALELYPWLAYYYFQTGDIDRARECGTAITELAEKTGNPIGKAIAAMIESSLCIIEQDERKADQYKCKSFQILKEAVPQTTYSPVAHYLDRMVEQQAELSAG